MLLAHGKLNIGRNGLPCRGHHEELRCVLAVIRHGDRTPKQKMKMKVTQVGGPDRSIRPSHAIGLHWRGN